jgi:hypothetical protein
MEGVLKKHLLIAFAAVTFASSLPAHGEILNITGGGLSPVSVTSDVSLWSLVDDLTTSTPPGANGKNAALRYYVVATGSGGTQSVFSIGELNPSFGGTNAAPFVTNNGGSLSLIDPNANASFRNVTGLTSLQILSAPAAPTGAGGATTSLTLSGLVSNPGSYSLADLQSLPSYTTTTTYLSGGNPVVKTFTGASLWTFLDPSDLVDLTTQIVVAQASDGYEVVYSLAELAPILGGNPLLAYSDTTGGFPNDGFARTAFPGDRNGGRYVSNLISISVSSAVPEPSTWAMMILGFIGLGTMTYRRHKIAADRSLCVEG